MCARDNHRLGADLPESFDGFTLLHLSDLHVDINSEFVHELAATIRPLRYDLCVYQHLVCANLDGKRVSLSAPVQSKKQQACADERMHGAPIFDVPKVRPLPEHVRFEIVLQSQALLDMDTPEAWHESGERRPFLWTQLRRFHQVNLPCCQFFRVRTGLYHALTTIDGQSRSGHEARFVGDEK